MSSHPTCPTCGGWLRWDGAQWLCDRCRVVFPPQQQVPQAVPQQPMAAAPARSSKKLLLVIAALLVIGGGVALILVFALGGGGERGAGSPEALAKAAAGLLKDGDGDGYVRLFPDPDMKVVDCKNEDEEKKADAKKEVAKQIARVKARVAKAKGKVFEVLAIEERKDSRQEIKAGKELGDDCKAVMDFANAEFEVAINRGEGFDDKGKGEVRLRAAQAGGRWYLADVWMAPELDAEEEAAAEAGRKPDTGGTEVGAKPESGSRPVAEFEEITNAICACRDAVCAEREQERLGRLGEKYKDYKPSPAEEAKVNELSVKMSMCLAKVMEGAGTP